MSPIFELSTLHHSEVRTVDCVSKEELVASSLLTIVINAHREVCAIQKMGGTELLPEQVCLLAQ